MEWTREDDKRFELALVIFPEDSPNRFENVAKHINMSLLQVIEHHHALVYDVALIESGRVDIPNYLDYLSDSDVRHRNKDNKDRKRGITWSEDEHRLFLEGLKKHGKGDWKNISRNFVMTRTPTQVASHAQKYYLRKEDDDNKTRKRSSIYDITSVD